MHMATVFSNTVILVVLLFAVEALSDNDSCAATNSGDPIESCCDLGFRPSLFSHSAVNKPKVYKLKNFCDSCRSLLTEVFCDTLTDGGGWLVVQRRKNGTENFHRGWNDYERGFGSLTDELWYGLRALHCLTKKGQWEMRIDFTYNNGTKSYLHYNSFRVGPAADMYRLSISGFTGITPTDPFTEYPINGQRFTTFDRDNDESSGNCGANAGGNETPGGWWYKNCFLINLNYNYDESYGLMHIAGAWYSPELVEMKIRPVNCVVS